MEIFQIIFSDENSLNKMKYVRLSKNMTFNFHKNCLKILSWTPARQENYGKCTIFGFFNTFNNNVWLVRYKEGKDDVFEKWLSLTITGVGGLFLRFLFGLCLKIDEVNNYLRGRTSARARERRPRRC